MADTRPTFEMTLPSLGLLYDGKLPGGKVEYKPMTAKEEKLLAGGGRNGAVSIIDAIIKSCLPNLPISVDDLLTNDKYFILLVLRAQSYGSSYKFPVKCQGCERKFTHEVNLGFTGEDTEDSSTFTVKLLAEDTVEPFTTKLPFSKDTVKFRLLRGTDEKQIQRFVDSALSKGKVEGDPAYIYRLAKHIVSINDKELDSFSLQDYVENMIGGDSSALRNAIEDVDFGIDSTCTAVCPRCDEENEFALPMTAEFFRPR